MSPCTQCAYCYAEVIQPSPYAYLRCADRMTDIPSKVCEKFEQDENSGVAE